MQRPICLAPASGAMPMALGIFALAAAPRLPALGAVLPRIVAGFLVLLWVGMALAFVAQREAGRQRFARDPVEGFAVGTWVAASAVTAELLLKALPSLRGLALALGAAALLLWLWYSRLVVAGVRALVRTTPLSANGSVLLPAVATQSLLLFAAAAGRVPRGPAAAALALGYALYAIGLRFVVRRYRRQAHWGLARDWDDSNCIVHGALSISGLAGIASAAAPPASSVATWIAAALLLVIVEGLEFARMAQRLRLFGLRRGVLVYYVPQWARNFTLGMFYAFSAALQADPAACAMLAALGLARALAEIVAWGAWIVLLLLLAELGLLAADRFNA